MNTELPPGVSIDVYQGRFDYADHSLEIAVANHGRAPLEVVSAEFSSPTFTPAAGYARVPTTVRPGTSTDLKVLLPPAVCAAEPGDPVVAIDFTIEGVAYRVTMTPDDRLGQLPKIAAEDCRGEFVAEVATIEAASGFTETTIDGRPAAELEFTATPTGQGGILTIDTVRGSPLVSLRDPVTGIVGETVPLELDIGSAKGPVPFTLTLIPARCDPHVVQEDKRGTFFTFTVTTRQDTGVIYLGVSDAVRSALYDFVALSCGWDRH
ncbi:hypothetical protein GCM10022239_24360 [Leifsonia bigeumensis]|uniref:Abnormal spindle-like microcephaly-associated protein ASH domain-containing protein n=1 Tax=Leifsonella bigeumensis TaxID=433643 RepID=A0ABP7FTN6_9MICO